MLVKHPVKQKTTKHTRMEVAIRPNSCNSGRPLAAILTFQTALMDMYNAVMKMMKPGTPVSDDTSEYMLWVTCHRAFSPEVSLSLALTAEYTPTPTPKRG